MNCENCKYFEICNAANKIKPEDCNYFGKILKVKPIMQKIRIVKDDGLEFLMCGQCNNIISRDNKFCLKCRCEIDWR